MTRLALLFLLGALLAASIVANFGSDVAARVIDALSSSNQHQSQSRGSEASGLGRVAQLLGSDSKGASGIEVHARSVAPGGGEVATGISAQWGGR